MQVIFIHHSCFLVEVDEKVLIFDWFAGDRIKGTDSAGNCMTACSTTSALGGMSI